MLWMTRRAPLTLWRAASISPRQLGGRRLRAALDRAPLAVRLGAPLRFVCSPNLECGERLLAVPPDGRQVLVYRRQRRRLGPQRVRDLLRLGSSK